MIVKRLTFFTQNLVICSFQVTNNVRSGHDSTSTSFVQEDLVIFRLQAKIAIWVSPWLERTTFIDQISLNSCGQSGKSCNRSVCTSSRSAFFFVFWFLSVYTAGSPKLFTRTSTSFGYWIFGVSVDIKYGILWLRWWWSRCGRCSGVGEGVVEEELVD